MIEDPSEAAQWSQLLATAAGAKAQPALPLEPFWQLYAPIAEGEAAQAFVVGQLGQSLDGRIATATGHSHYINGQIGRASCRERV